MTALWLLLRAIPLRTWLIVALIGASVGWGVQMRSRAFDAGYAKRDNEQKIVDAADATAAADRQVERAEVTEKVVTQYVDRVRVVREKAKEIVRNVYVQVPVDACPIDGSFRVLHDRAAGLQTGAVPDAAGNIDGAPVDVATAAATVVENYGACAENAETLIGLQGWVREQGGVE